VDPVSCLKRSILKDFSFVNIGAYSAEYDLEISNTSVTINDGYFEI